MCGRYKIDFDPAELGELLHELNREYDLATLERMRVGEVRPTDLAPVIAPTGLEMMRWGFPGPESGRPVINARAETAAQRRMFSASLAERRVIVPTSGFFEWTHAGSKPCDKYLFTPPGERLMYLAALYAQFDGEHRFVILTTAANDSMRPFHDRMPVCIAPSERRAWLSDARFAAEALRRPQPELSAARTDPAKPEQLSLF